jgi:hypothetical protein
MSAAPLSPCRTMLRTVWYISGMYKEKIEKVEKRSHSTEKLIIEYICMDEMYCRL